MKHPVRLRVEAENDLRAAMAWYDEQRDGLGGELLTEVDVALGDVANGPDRFPLVVPPFRRVLLHRPRWGSRPQQD